MATSIGMTSKLVLAFATLIIGVMLLTSIASEEQKRTTKTHIGSETVTISSARIAAGGINPGINFTVVEEPTNWKVADCPLVNVVFRNASGSALTLNTDYAIVLATGVLSLKQTAEVMNQSGGPSASNTTSIDYDYCADDYLNLSWGRTGLNIIPGFFAIALMLVAVGLFYSVAKDADII